MQRFTLTIQALGGKTAPATAPKSQRPRAFVVIRNQPVQPKPQPVPQARRAARGGRR